MTTTAHGGGERVAIETASPGDPPPSFREEEGSRGRVECRVTVPSYSWGIHNLRGNPPTDARCTHCERWLPLERFAPNPRLRSGLNSWCRECQVGATRRWREANPGYQAAYNERRRLGARERACVD